MKDLFGDDERWQLAVELFNKQDWYAAHDAFEELWYESVGEQRSILQGIIQIAVAEHHLQNGNQRGSLLLMAEGLNRLQSVFNEFWGLDIENLRQLTHRRLTNLQSGQSLAELPSPALLRRLPIEV